MGQPVGVRVPPSALKKTPITFVIGVFLQSNEGRSLISCESIVPNRVAPLHIIAITKETALTQ